MAVRIVKHAMEIIYFLTDQKLIQVIVDAIVNISVGVVRCQAIDILPNRCVNQKCLADELINTAKGSSNSYAIKKKMKLKELPRPTVDEGYWKK
ncbi:hypothetical protein Goshw_005147 [Gossypium schwendimanii]|uniref:Ribosomal protein S7 domain-containing protein n=1 Tax=Gossypium schwendimanii TaxID=34291 RepID=A0A7J9KQ80_GOSSC|nr:hypothetical protein [Gossypium schwendimanii]